MKFTNTTDFDTNITATQFAVTFNGYLVNYVSKLDYVNEVTNNPATTTSFILFLPLDANIPPHSSLFMRYFFRRKSKRLYKRKVREHKGVL